MTAEERQKRLKDEYGKWKTQFPELDTLATFSAFANGFAAGYEHGGYEALESVKARLGL